ncbi:hypothetical protein [Microbacterium stercoris]|uniref:Uncharacterized protein n=1 Tax=Microbacterium stercoris TaxID=2820289 RepID=A0A939TYJ9_9MICO|nr:hypothetical protein [Microbacterium stercoris]MBO3664787.1 hypothetical protein [Microbacterium stercoris]
MTDISAAVPSQEPAEDALAFASKLALAAVPVVGGMAAEALAHALDTRQAQRQHDFNRLLARELDAVVGRLDATLTLKDVVDSDEFLAAVTRAQRTAAETASEAKRRRLAAAVANAGSWARFSATERAHFARLVEEYDDLHIWLLHYFVDPRAWLEAHDMLEQHANNDTSTITAPLTTALGTVHMSEPARAVADIERAGLTTGIPLTTIMEAQGTISPRTNAKGRRFLAYLTEAPSRDAEPPAL